jgi:hypothetical protein
MKTLLFSLAVLLVSLPVAAQDHPRMELFLGYSALVTPSDEAVITDGFDTVRVKRETAFVNGWNASLAVNANSWLGFVGDFSGHYGPVDYNASDSINNLTFGTRTRVHQYMVGPQFSRRGDSTRLFVRALIGAVTVKQSVSIEDLNINETETGLAVGAGGGLDIRINDRLSWRAVQADYFWYRFGQPKLIVNGAQISNSTTQNNFRISTGLIFKN